MVNCSTSMITAGRLASAAGPCVTILECAQTKHSCSYLWPQPLSLSCSSHSKQRHMQRQAALSKTTCRVCGCMQCSNQHTFDCSSLTCALPALIVLTCSATSFCSAAAWDSYSRHCLLRAPFSSRRQSVCTTSTTLCRLTASQCKGGATCSGWEKRSVQNGKCAKDK